MIPFCLGRTSGHSGRMQGYPLEMEANTNGHAISTRRDHFLIILMRSDYARPTRTDARSEVVAGVGAAPQGYSITRHTWWSRCLGAGVVIGAV